MKPAIVYWAINEYDPAIWAQKKLLLQDPESLFVDRFGINTSPSRSSRMLSCPAHRSTKSNMYMFRFPLDMKFSFNENGQVMNDQLHAHMVHPSEQNSSTDRWTIILKFPIIFYSETSLEMEITPPYFHKTAISEHGHIAVGKFNISKWFRPVNWEFVLWPQHKIFTCTKGDPSMYLRFMTDRPVLLKQFRMSDFAFSVGAACASMPSHEHNKPLSYRYAQFEKSNISKSLIKDIKNSLI